MLRVIFRLGHSCCVYAHRDQCAGLSTQNALGLVDVQQ